MSSRGSGAPVSGPSAGPGRAGWQRATAAVVVVALAAAGLAFAARRALDDPSLAPVDLGDRAPALAVEVPATGVVVTLSRPGFVDLPARAGGAVPFVVEAAGVGDVVATELVVDGTVVDRVVPHALRPARSDRLTWTPSIEAGVVLVLARAYLGDGRVGQSNPLRMAVRAPTPLAARVSVEAEAGDSVAGVAARVGADASVTAEWNEIDPATIDLPFPRRIELEVPVAAPTGPASAPAPSFVGVRRGSGLPPLPTGLTLLPPPVLDLDLVGCEAVPTIEPGTADQIFTLLELPPAGGGFRPVALADDGLVPVSVGRHDFVAVGAAGERVSWSSPVSVEVDDPACSGWSGTARLEDGRLVVGGDGLDDVDEAYLYLSTADRQWVRVPATGAVPRSATGFDFADELPPLTGATVRIEAWGRASGSLLFLGAGTYTPPPEVLGDDATSTISSAIAAALPVPAAQLWWLQPADWKHEGDPPTAVTAGNFAEDPGVLEFQWSTAVPGVTHGLVQVTAAPVPTMAGPQPGGLLGQTLAVGNGGTFTLDVSVVLATLAAQQQGKAADASAAVGGSYQVMSGLFGDAPPPTASPAPIDLDPTDDFDELIAESMGQDLYIRVVPMATDTWTGLTSNDVRLNVGKDGVFDVAPAGARPYEIDVELVAPPRPPDPRKMNCWQFTGWKDDAALAAALDAELAAAKADQTANLGTYTVWKALVDQVGTAPICGGCYKIGSSLKVAVAGGVCDDGTFLDDLFDAFKTFVDMLSSSFAFLKAQLIDLVVTATGCAAAGKAAQDLCTTLAGVVLDAALVSTGIPPSLPNWDQLVAAAKADLVALGVGLATQLGVPCDDASFAAEVSGASDLTCEAALAALLDAAVAQIDELYGDVAAGMGYHFPPLMKVKPHPTGQVAPAEVRVTVHPTQFSAAENGVTCSAAVSSSSFWTATGDPAATSAHGETFGAPIVTGVVPDFAPGITGLPLKIPKAWWPGLPFEKATWALPSVPGSTSVSRTFQLYPPTNQPSVTVGELVTMAPGGSTAPSQTLAVWHQWPAHVFLLNRDALFTLNVTAPCATGGGPHTWKLPGFAAGPATKVGP